MKKLEKSLMVCLVATLAAFCWTVAQADTWDETANGGGDAGDFPTGTFQMAPDDSVCFDVITGDNGPFGGTPIDSYLITVTDESIFYVEDIAGNDTRAFMWDQGGNPLFSCDDNAGPNANGFSLGFGDVDTHLGAIIGTIPDLQNGDTFVLSVGAFGDVANGDAGGTVFLDDGGDFSAAVGPTGENFVSYVAGGQGPYEINLFGCELANATGNPACVSGMPCTNLIGDLNGDGMVTLLDVAPFVSAIQDTSTFDCEADINQDGTDDLLDVQPFVTLVLGG